MIPYPANPKVGDKYRTPNDVLMQWTGSRWVPLEEPKPMQGPTGPPGKDGKDGKDGEDGESIKGDKGDPGQSIKGDKGDPGKDSTIPGPMGPEGPPGPQGKEGDLKVATKTPAPPRVIGTAFQPNANRPCAVYYTAELTANLSLTVLAPTSKLQLFCDASNPPTTLCAEVQLSPSLGVSGLLGATLAIGQKQRFLVNYIVPAGHWVRLVQTNTNGGTAAIVIQREVDL